MLRSKEFVVKISELIKILERHGCYLKKNKTRHYLFYSPITNKEFTVPRHPSKEVKIGTCKNILKDAGIQL
jgi:predicted RNA binding protein YcfA (HicA-like mRNA interferase family)